MSSTRATSTPSKSSPKSAKGADSKRSAGTRRNEDAKTAGSKSAAARAQRRNPTSGRPASANDTRSPSSKTQPKAAATAGGTRSASVSAPQAKSAAKKVGQAKSSVGGKSKTNSTTTKAKANSTTKAKANSTTKGSGSGVGPAGRQARPLGGTATASTGMLDRLGVKRGRGGVAPFVPPSRRAGRRFALRRLKRRGFVPLSPGRPKLRHRVLPRTVIGIAFMLLALAVGSAFSGAAFYAYYDNRLATSEATVARFVEGFDQQFADAAGVLDDLRVESITDIRTELSPLGEFVSDANGVVGLPALAGPSVWTVETRDEAGKPMLGSSFAVAPHRGGTAFVTSYELVVASTVAPSPPIELVKGEQRLTAQLWAWDQANDMALLVVDEVVPPLDMASDSQQVDSVGRRVFALSGVGGQGATASPGVLLDHAEQGLQHTAPVGALFRGGPLVTGDGVVVGVASNGYQPYGIDQGSVPAAPAVSALCSQLLECAGSRGVLSVSVDGEAADVPEDAEVPGVANATDSEPADATTPAANAGTTVNGVDDAAGGAEEEGDE